LIVLFASVALLVFAATMGFDLPRPPVAAHAAWADVALAAAAVFACVAWAKRRWSPSVHVVVLAAAFVGWTILAALLAPAPALVPVLGAAALGVLLVVTEMAVRAEGDALRDALARAWIYGAIAVGAIGLVAGAAAQLGVDIAPLHRGDGELGLAFRPAGVQRVGLVAELALVPLLLLVADGARLVGRRARIAGLVLLTLVLAAGLTRSLLAAALGLGLQRLKARPMRIGAVVALVAIAFVALRFDVHDSGAPGIRWRIAASAARTAAAHPLIGSGPMAEVAWVGWPGPDDPPRGWTAHLTPLDLAASAGIPAALLFVILFAYALRRAGQARESPFGDAMWVGLWATAFDALMVDVEHFRHVWLLLGLAIGSADRKFSKHPR
jgi:hypothetical protein